MAEHDENPLVVELQTLRTEALARLDDIADLTALDTWRIALSRPPRRADAGDAGHRPALQRHSGRRSDRCRTR